MKRPNLQTPLLRQAPAILLAAVLGSSALPTPASAHVMPLTERQIAAGSSHVVVGVVESARTRWNEQRTLPFTDYSIRIEDRLRGDAPERITLSLPGGTLDGRTYETCLSFPLESGSRYLLFLEDLDRQLLVPVTGGWQGAFREVREPRGKSLAARAGEGGEGEIQGDFAQLVRSTRELLENVEADPRPADTAWMRTFENPDIPVQPYEPLAMAEPQPRQVTAGATPNFIVDTPPAAPIVFDPLPPGSPFSPADREMIRYWNIYLRQPLFLVNPDPSPEWAFGNRVSEIAFASSQTFEEQFGGEWGSGGYAAMSMVYEEGVLVETDIALNPERRWIVGDTEPDVFGLGPDTTFSFKSVLLQHLAMVWGYRGTLAFEGEPTNPADQMADSIANFGSFSLPVLTAVDAAAVRATYGGKPIHDGLVSPYTISLTREGYRTWSHSLPSVEVAAAGSTVTFSAPFKIENPGTSKLARPTIEIYLAPKRGSLKGAVLLKRLRLRNAVRPGEVRRVDPGSARIPAKTPAGAYHIVFVLRDARDAYQPNNQAWSHPEFTFEVTR